MNQLSFLGNRFQSSVSVHAQAFTANIANPGLGLSFGALLGGQMGGIPQFSSPLMQGLFGSMQSNPLTQFFQQMGSSYQGQTDPYGGFQQTPYWGSQFGGPSYGGYGCSPQYQAPPPPHQGCHQSPCQHYNFGQQCHPGCRDFGNQMGSCCHQSNQQTGQVEQEADGKPITYTTSGGYTVNVDGHTIKITDPNGKNTMKTWGDPHENVNGKHVSDWQEKQRTIVLDDGTKLTMSADNPKGVVESMSIFDGNQSLSIDNTQNTITNQTYNPFQTRALEQSQYDGSVAYLNTGQDGSLSFANYYTEDENFGITRDYQLLATVNSGGTVTDHFDDPTHKNT